MNNKTIGEIKINNPNFWERLKIWKTKKYFNYWKTIKKLSFKINGFKFEFKISCLQPNRNLKNIKKWK